MSKRGKKPRTKAKVKAKAKVKPNRNIQNTVLNKAAAVTVTMKNRK